MVLNRVNGGDASITHDRIPQCSKLNVTWSMYSEGKKMILGKNKLSSASELCVDAQEEWQLFRIRVLP